MIRSFRHGGLQRLWELGSRKGIGAREVEKILRILYRLNEATMPSQLDIQGHRLHQLSGDRSGTWSIRVTRNWRITFRFEGSDVHDINYEDYH